MTEPTATQEEPQTSGEYQFGLQAFLCGLLFGLGIDLASRFEKWTSIARHFFALGLVLLAIGGHWLAIRVFHGI